jgi:hypothetical protein
MTDFTSFLATEHSSATFWMSSDFDIMRVFLPLPGRSAPNFSLWPSGLKRNRDFCRKRTDGKGPILGKFADSEEFVSRFTGKNR